VLQVHKALTVYKVTLDLMGLKVLLVLKVPKVDKVL
jgi:hypothetical protein